MYTSSEQPRVKKFSKMDTLETVAEALRQEFRIDENDEIRLWLRSGGNTYEALSNLDHTIDRAGLTASQTVAIEVRNNDGSWPKDFQTLSKRGAVTLSGSSSTPDGNPIRMVPPGLCGLSNLGNTCFMNSVLQCMSNTPPVVSYFLENRYEKELNPTNPLGNQGEIAKAFAELLKAMWSGHHSSYAPKAFKYQVGRFAPQFYGYQQHDSQELLTFLLDGLHEDLNRIVKKPYIEQKDSDGRPDSEVAREAWDNYKKRNDSIIVDLFHGLLKSTLVCPECQKVSVTFDPTCYLSLPLPVKRERNLDVTVVSLNPSQKPIQYRVTVPKAGNVQDLLDATSKLCGIEPSRLIATEVHQHRFHQFFRLPSPLADITDKDYIYLYEVQDKPSSDKTIQLAVYMKEVKKKPCGYSPQFGLPFVLQIPSEGVTYDELYQLVLSRMQRYVTPLDDKDERWLKLQDKEEVDDGSDVEMNDVTENDDSLPNGNEEDAPAVQPHYLFNLECINPTGTTTRKLVPDGQPITFASETAYIACEWPPSIRESCYDEDAAKDSELGFSQQQRATNKKQVLQLNECLELFTSTELLGEEDAWYCPSCKKHQRATKKFDLWSLPDVLVIHLKRFSYTRFLRDKLDTLVEFPTRGLDMTSYIINKEHPPAVYDLIGVCNHYGGLGGGHYTAFAKNKDNSQWYCFDDSSVSSVSEDSVCSKAAYVLFYLRRGGTASMTRSLKLQSKSSPVPVHKAIWKEMKEASPTSIEGNDDMDES